MIKMGWKMEDAIRFKEIAKKKMQNKDFVGALECALTAQKLDPELVNISRILTICKVHVSAKSNAIELANWYGILEIPKTADELSIEEQYQNLSSLLHPNKNRFAGAEAAFKLIKEAHGVLSNQAQRSLYDSKPQTIIQTAKLTQALPQPERTLYSHIQPSVENNFTNHCTSQHQGMNRPHEQTRIHPTFWTSCPFCTYIRYLYYRTLLNKAIGCPKCLKPFIAFELNDQEGLPNADPGDALNQSAHPQHKNVTGLGAHQVGQQFTIGNSSSTMPSQVNVNKEASSSGPFSKTKPLAGLVVSIEAKPQKI